MKNAVRPMIILGSGAITGEDGHAILSLAREVTQQYKMIDTGQNWNGFNVLHTAASRVGGLDLGLVPGKDGRDVSGILAAAGTGNIKAVYLLGADEIDMSALGDAFVIYQGHHGDAGAHRADVILPGAAYTEKNATYVNTEGRVQRTHLAVFPPGEAREDWTIIRALSDILGHKLPYNSLQEVRGRMVSINDVFMTLDDAVPAAWGEFGVEGGVSSEPLISPVDNFYMTDVISRASVTMAKCADEFLGTSARKTGTDG